ncbi:hypothetical protein ACQ4PT_014632 [Festuca glaucescens]
MGNFLMRFSQDEIPGTLPKDEMPGVQPLGGQGTSVVGQFHGPLLRVDDGQRPLANAGDGAKALAHGRFNHSGSTSTSPSTLPKDEIPGGQPLGRQSTSGVGQFHGPLLRVDDGRRPLANAGDGAKALAHGCFNHSGSTSASPSLPKEEMPGGQPLGRQGTSVVGQFHGVNERCPLANTAKAIAPGRFNPSGSTSASPSTSTEILTAEGEKMRAVADYWARMKKGKRTLDSWDLTYLECEIFSWSLEDVLNKNLLKEKVGISHPLHQTRHSILLTNSFCDNKVDKHENA